MMKTKRDNTPFHNWVSRPLGILILLLMFFPPTFSGGAYLSNVSEMTGGLGVQPEDIQLASFFTNIGMCLFPPFMIRFLQTRPIKQTYLVGFGLLLVLNGICAVTHSIPVLCLICLIIGIVRVMGMLNCTFTIAPYLTGMNTLDMFTATQTPSPEEQYLQERKRTFLMPVLYTYILFIAQLSNVLTAWFSYHYTWQEAYYVVMGMLLLAILMVGVTMVDSPKSTKVKLDWTLLPDMLAMLVILCCLTYILVYGKTLDWMDAPSIGWAVAGTLLGIGIFLLLAFRKRETHYLPLEAFKYRNIWISTLLFILFMIFNSATLFITTHAKLSTPINNLQSASLSNWAIVGCLLGFILAVWMVARKVRFRFTFIVGLSFMMLSNVYMYFSYQSIGNYHLMAIPMVLNFTGLLIMYSLVPAFSMKNLPSRYLVSAVFIMIWARNALAPVLGSSIYSNWLNERQQYYITTLADDVDIRNNQATLTYQKNKRLGYSQGKSSIEAEQLATATLKGKITVQATFLAMKDITGKTIWLMLGTLVLVIFLPYHKDETT